MQASGHRQATVFGAGGFIGRHIVRALLADGWRVRAFVHLTEPVPFAAGPNLLLQRGDVCDAAAVAEAMQGSSAVINAAGAKRDEPESEAVNVGGARNLAAAARRLGTARIVQISTQSVKIPRPGVYARTKLAADEVLERSGLPVTILRPSVVYGPGQSGVFSTMENFVTRWPVVPVLGDGRWRSAPIHAADVADAVVRCLAAPVTIGRAYDLGGPELVTLDDLLDRIARRHGRRCRKLHVPLPLALAGARLLAGVWPRGPVTVSNVLGSNQSTEFDPAPAASDFGFRARPLEEGWPEAAMEAEGPAEAEDGPDVLEAEAKCFAGYLLDVEADPELCVRYREAVRQRRLGRPDADLRFVRRHPWALPLLDGAAAWVRPTSLLRRRVLVMAAVLETTPTHAAWYLAPPPRPLALGAGVIWRGCTSVGKAMAGLVLLTVVR